VSLAWAVTAHRTGGNIADGD